MLALLSLPSDAAGWLSFLGQVSARAAVVLGVPAGVCWALRRASAALRHLVWTLAIICALCLPVLSIVLPAWRVRGVPLLLAPPTELVQEPASYRGPGVGGDVSLPLKPTAAPRPATMAPSSPSPAATPRLAGGPGPSRVTPQVISSAALGVWAFGAVIALLPTLMGLVCVARLLRRSRAITEDPWRDLVDDASAQLQLRRPVRVLRSPLETVPMMWGWLRPVLLLPAGADGWPPERRRLVLLHELAHVRRGDCLTQMLGQLACALYWPNPLAWLAGHRLRQERERACDDLVLRRGFRASEYAGHLLGIAKVSEGPLFAAVAAVAMARLSGLEGRIRAVLDPGRSRRGLSRRSGAAAVAAAVVLLGALACVQGGGTEAADTAAYHGPGRVQWQPQITEGGYDPDRRLEQRVRIEIPGRAAIPALALLSEKSDVSLQVAPEDLETVGERKLTIIAQGCTLKAIMVWIPTALQECHWDIDRTGPQPAYLLHRNGGAEEVMARLVEEELLRRQAEGRPAREARVEAARKALAMSPEELAELEKTDLYLARSVKDPKSRFMLELFLSLPEEQMRQFIDTAIAAMPYPSAPEHFRKAADKLLQDSREEWTAKEGTGSLNVKIVDVVQGDISHATIQYEDDGGGGSYLRIFAFGKEGGRYSWGVEPALWSQYPSLVLEYWYRPLLLGSGTPDEKAADALAQEWERKGAEERERREEQKRKAEWREPRSPQLHRTITLPFKDKVDPIEVQRFIAKESGLSLVSDYYTNSWLWPVHEEARAAMPIWWLLYVLADHWLWTYDWNEAGDCLVFHDRYWYRKPPEVPESLVEAWREKLQEQGGLTLDDAAAAAVALASRVSSRPDVRWPKVAVPNDLARVGLSPWALTSPYVLLYASLSPEQRAKAWSAAGLPFAEMTRAQQELVRRGAAGESASDSVGRTRIPRAVPEEEIAKGVFRIKQSRRNITEPGPGDLLAAGTYEAFELQVVFPSRQVGTQVWLRPPKPSA